MLGKNEEIWKKYGEIYKRGNYGNLSDKCRNTEKIRRAELFNNLNPGVAWLQFYDKP